MSVSSYEPLALLKLSCASWTIGVTVAADACTASAKQHYTHIGRTGIGKVSPANYVFPATAVPKYVRTLRVTPSPITWNSAKVQSLFPVRQLLPASWHFSGKVHRFIHQRPRPLRETIRPSRPANRSRRSSETMERPTCARAQPKLSHASANVPSGIWLPPDPRSSASSMSLSIRPSGSLIVTFKTDIKSHIVDRAISATVRDDLGIVYVLPLVAHRTTKLIGYENRFTIANPTGPRHHAFTLLHDSSSPSR